MRRRELWARRREEKLKNANSPRENLDALAKRYKHSDNNLINSSQKNGEYENFESGEDLHEFHAETLYDRDYEGDDDTTNETIYSNNTTNRIKRFKKKRNSPSNHDVVDLTID